MQLKFAFTIAPKFVPLLAPPPTKSGGARAHPDYMVPAPLHLSKLAFLTSVSCLIDL